jgi:hypothetical protein
MKALPSPMDSSPALRPPSWQWMRKDWFPCQSMTLILSSEGKCDRLQRRVTLTPGQGYAGGRGQITPCSHPCLTVIVRCAATI